MSGEVDSIIVKQIMPSKNNVLKQSHQSWQTLHNINHRGMSGPVIQWAYIMEGDEMVFVAKQ